MGRERGSWRYFSYPLLSSSKIHKLKYTIPCFSHFFSLLSQTSPLKSCLSRKYRSQFSRSFLFTKNKIFISCSLKKKKNSKVVLFLLYSSPLFSSVVSFFFSSQTSPSDDGFSGALSVSQRRKTEKIISSKTGRVVEVEKDQ